MLVRARLNCLVALCLVPFGLSGTGKHNEPMGYIGIDGTAWFPSPDHRERVIPYFIASPHRGSAVRASRPLGPRACRVYTNNQATKGPWGDSIHASFPSCIILGVDASEHVACIAIRLRH